MPCTAEIFSSTYPASLSPAVKTPLLVLMGNDLYHPAETSRELATLAPNATLIEHWKEPEHQSAAKKAVERFLAEHTPR